MCNFVIWVICALCVICLICAICVVHVICVICVRCIYASLVSYAREYHMCDMHKVYKKYNLLHVYTRENSGTPSVDPPSSRIRLC